MFIAELMTVMTQAMRQTFDSNYPEADFRELYVSPEFPIEHTQYPSVWVDFATDGPLTTAGIDHFEVIETDDGSQIQRRWLFKGEVSFTVLSMSSLERARIADEIIAIIAFGKGTIGRGAFRSYIEESNPLLAINLDSDTIGLGGWGSTSGTPWGSDEWIYEVTVTVSVVGEFVSTPEGTLVDLTAVNIYERREDEPDTTTNDPAWH